MSQTLDPPVRPRARWVDIERGGTTLLVLVFHSTGLLRYSQAETPSSLARVNEISEPFWLSTFSFLSGYVSEVPDDEDLRRFASERARTTLYPFGVWTAVHALTFRTPLRPKMVLRLATGGTYLFFLAFLPGFQVAAYLTDEVAPELVALGALAASAIGPRALPQVPSRFTEAFPHMLAMFMLGRAARARQDTWEQALENRFAVLVSSGAALAAATARLRGHSVTYKWNWAWAPALAMLAFARLARWLEASPVSRPLAFVGRGSVVYYTAHFPLAYVTIRALDRRGVKRGGTIVLGAIAVSALGSSALAFGRQRSRLLRRCFALTSRR